MSAVVHVAFTGTRAGMTGGQVAAFRAILAMISAQVPDRALVLHHGDCVGADAEAHRLFVAFGTRHRLTIMHGGLRFWTEAHPSNLPGRYQARTLARVRHAPQRPLTRNREIVNLTTPVPRVGERGVVIAAPKQPQEVLRSGTWATVRYALEAGRTVLLLRPDGTVETLINEEGT